MGLQSRLGAGEDDLNPSESKRQRRREADYRLAEAARQQQAAEQARRRRIEEHGMAQPAERGRGPNCETRQARRTGSHTQGA